MSANGESVTDEVSRSSLNESHTGNTNHGSPLTETASLTQDPTDFSVLGDEDLEDDEAVLETHSQNNILNSSADNSRRYIKRPLNAYMIWTRRARDGILKANPHLKMNEVSKSMGEMWKKMPDEEKKPYFKEAREKAAKHKKALEAHPELAYVPSRKKIKRADKPPDEPIHKTDSKIARTGDSPTPSASPHPCVTRQGFVHPGQGSSQVVDNNRTVYPATSIVRTANPTVFSSQVHGTPQVQYQQEFRQPAPVSFAQPIQQVRYVAASAQPGQSLTYANGVSTQSTILNSAFQPASTVHFLADSRNPGSFLVRNPYVIPRNDSTEPTYEMESPELYKELYYRSLTQLQLPNRYGPDEKSSLAPELYLNRFYAVGGTDPPRESKTTTSNDLVYQQL